MHRVIGEGAIMGTFLSDSFLLRQGSLTTKRAKLDRSFKALSQAGLAWAYDGGKRSGWCE